MRDGLDSRDRSKLIWASLFHIPLFLFLLPAFFIFHNYFEHSGFIPLADVFFLVLFYWGIGILLYLAFFLFFRNSLKSAFAVLILLSFHFFFGAFHDMLKLHSGFFSKYSVLVPLMLMVILLSVFILKRNYVSDRVRIFLNLLFAVLICYDLIQMVLLKKEPEKELLVNSCEACEQPDVHFIVLDGYAGQKQLEAEFNFTNDEFLGRLKNLGFEIASSSFSNYSNTPFSMASILNMEYLPLHNYEYTDSNLNYCFEAIYDNRVVGSFKKLGYDFVNNSIFDIDEKPASINKTFLISGTELITSQTFVSRFRRDVYYNVLAKHFPHSQSYQDFLFSDLENNNRLIENLKENPENRTGRPRFIYTHLMMPHFPYYFNEEGRIYAVEDLLDQNYQDEKLYLPYLKYTNKKILALIESIMKHSQKKPVILLMSDHGFRKEGFSPGLSFMNLNALLVPGREIKNYPDTISGVNQFRFLFNSLFKQNFQLQENSIVK